MSLDLKNFQSALEEVLTERGIPREKILETIEMALAAAYKKDYGKRGQIIKAKFNSTKGKAEFYQVKIVVDESMLKEEIEDGGEETPTFAENEVGVPTTDGVGIDGEPKKVRFNTERHIMIGEAKKIKADVNAGDELIFPLETKEDYVFVPLISNIE